MRFLALIILPFLILACEQQATATSTDSVHSLVIVSADGKQHDFKVDLALTPQQQQTGLMNRTNMAPDAGMLFVFGNEEVRGFWMKNTLIPLDMIFIKKDGTIHHIHDSAIPNDLTSIMSEGPVSAVLELNGGTAKTLGIKPGDKVHHAVFENSLP